MAADGTKRKLSAILSADVKGYSRLMSQDERGTIRTLTAYKGAMASLIQQYKGRVVDSPGDNLLAEFASVVDAVNCAVEIQRELAERNAELPPARQMEFRIGINLGDIVEEEGRIYGDGVNIAARVESLAEAGGICISGTVHDQVENKLGLEYDYLGEQKVKNIAKPVRVYKVLSFPGAAAHRVVQAKGAIKRKWRKAALAVAAVLIIVIAAAVVWNLLFRPAPRLKEVASVERMAFALPDKPSIAVLPFVNISGDPEQEYISDGITEQMITALSGVPTLFVVARNSVFTYKGKPVKIKQVAEELGVRYVLEGSFQRSEDRVRIAAQLIDAITGHHMWAEHYDRDMKDLFALQDEIALNTMKALEVELKAGLQCFRGATDNLEAYLKVFKGAHHHYRWTKEDMALARKLYEEAIALDPNYAGAYHLLGWTHWQDMMRGWSESPAKSFEKAEELARKAIALDDSLATAHALLGYVYQRKGEHEKAIAEGERAVELSPNSSVDIVLFAVMLMRAGRPEEGVVLMERAIRLDPTPPDFYLLSLGHGYTRTGRYDEAIEALNKALLLNPNNLWTHKELAVVYISLGREEEARAEVAEILRISPKFSLEHLAKGAIIYKNPADAEYVIDALRKAGLK